MNLLVNQNGTLLKSEIEGQIRIKAFLSGMPEVRLGLNDRVQFGKVRRLDTTGKAVFFLYREITA